MSSRPRRHATSVAVTAISQALFAATNFAILVALRRAGTAAEVGRFALAFSVYLALLSAQRALLTDALLARPPGVTAGERDEERRTVVNSLLLGLAAAPVVVLVGFLTPYRQLALIALLFPALLLEDALRYLFFRRLQHATAAVLDGVAAITSLSAFVILPSHPTTRYALLIWGAGNVLACVVGLIALGFRPASPRAAVAWWRTALWPSSRWLGLEAFLYNIDLQAQAFGFTALAGAAAFGTYEVASALVGACAFLNTGVTVFVVSHVSRGSERGLRTATYASLVSFAGAWIVTGALLATSSFVVKLVLAHQNAVPNGMILVTGAIMSTVGLAGGMQALLRARRTERTLPVARGICVALCAPAAVVASAHSIELALWILAGEGLMYAIILAFAAVRGEASAVVAEPVPAPA